MNLRITDLLDEYMGNDIPMDPVPLPDTNRIKEAAMKKLNIRHRTVRPLRVILIAAVIVVLLGGTVLGVMHYAGITDSMEERWNWMGQEEMTQAQKDYIEGHSSAIGESIESQGVTITVDSVTCTTNTAYLVLRYEFDPEQYNVENIVSATIPRTPATIKNGAYRSTEETAYESRLLQKGVLEQEIQLMFSALPEDGYLGDGKTTLCLDLTEVWYGDQADMLEASKVYGRWSFSVPLPESERAEIKASNDVLSFDTTLEFENGVILEISKIEVDEIGCHFSVVTENEEYIFVGGDGDQAMLARAAQPDAPCFTVYACLNDGSMAYGGAGMTWEPHGDTDEWTLEWAAPVDPACIDALIFSDGSNEIKVPLE